MRKNGIESLLVEVNVLKIKINEPQILLNDASIDNKTVNAINVSLKKELKFKIPAYGRHQLS